MCKKLFLSCECLLMYICWFLLFWIILSLFKKLKYISTMIDVQHVDGTIKLDKQFMLKDLNLHM